MAALHPCTSSVLFGVEFLPDDNDMRPGYCEARLLSIVRGEHTEQG